MRLQSYVCRQGGSFVLLLIPVLQNVCVCLAGTHTRLYPEKGPLADVSRFSAGIRHLEDAGLEFE